MGPGRGGSGGGSSPAGGGEVMSGAGVMGALVGAVVNREGALRQNDWNREEAERNRNWQKMMSNSAIQRRMQDMRNAGINPILAGKYDASTPPGSLAHKMENVAQAGLSGANSAMETITQGKNLKLLEAQINKTNSETNLNQANTTLTETMDRLQGYNADIKQPAAFAIQTMMAMLPTDNPNEAAKLLKNKANEIVQKYGPQALHSAKETAAFIEDFVKTGLEMLNLREREDPNKDTPEKESRREHMAEYLEYQDRAMSTAKNKGKIPGRKQKVMTYEEYLKAKGYK